MVSQDLEELREKLIKLKSLLERSAATGDVNNMTVMCSGSRALDVVDELQLVAQQAEARADALQAERDALLLGAGCGVVDTMIEIKRRDEGDSHLLQAHDTLAASTRALEELLDQVCGQPDNEDSAAG